MFKRHPGGIDLQLPAYINKLRIKIGGFVGSIIHTNTADRVYTLPDATTTLVGTDATQTLTNKSIAASEINSGTLALARGGVNADISATGPGKLFQASNGANITVVEPEIIRVKNVSGSTANANEVGLVDFDGTNGASYNTTTTANSIGSWCVVVVGGANNADIWVARRGQVTVKLNANCSIGDFLTTSTTAGEATNTTTIRPEIFAVALTANSGGAGGTCTALLLCHRRLIPQTNANYIYAYVGGSLYSTRLWTGTQNGATSGATVTVTTSTGNLNNFQNISGHISDYAIRNITRSKTAWVSSVSGAVVTVTNSADLTGWTSGDSLTLESATCTSGIAYKYGDCQFNSGASKPNLAVAFWAQMSANDTGASGQLNALHPFDTFAGSKQIIQWTQAANVTDSQVVVCPLFGSKFCASWQCSGTTGQMFVTLIGWEVAEA